MSTTWLFATWHATWPISVYIAICSAIAIVCTMMLPDHTNKENRARGALREGLRPSIGATGYPRGATVQRCSHQVVFRHDVCKLTLDVLYNLV